MAQARTAHAPAVVTFRREGKFHALDNYFANFAELVLNGG